MDLLSLIAFLAFGGAAVGAYAFSRRARALNSETGKLREQHQETLARLGERDVEIAGLQVKFQAANDNLNVSREELTRARQDLNEKSIACNRAENELAALKAAREEEKRAFEARMGELKNLREELSAKFAELSQKALGENNKKFLELAGERLGRLNEQNAGDLEKRSLAVAEMLKPIREGLDKVGQSVREFDSKRAESFTQMTERIHALSEQEQKLRRETEALGEALRKPSVRGAWGELQLRRVVEFAGMLDHCHFEEQVVVGEEKRDRPDMIVNLPGGLCIIVDAKATMDAYMAALDAPNPEQRQALLADHVRQLRERIRLLGQKKYTSFLNRTPDFTVLFLPAESLFSTALSVDSTLLQYANDNNIVMATPTTLIALLMAVSKGWNEHDLAENATQLKSECSALYDCVCKFLDHYAATGKSLGKAVDAYNNSLGSLQRRLLPKARRINELGGFDTADAKLDDATPSGIETTPNIGLLPDLFPEDR